MMTFSRWGLIGLILACLAAGGCADKNRNRAITLMNEGIAQAERGNFNGAVRRLEEAVQVDDSFGMPYYYLGMIRLKEFHAPENAIPDLRRAADLMPDHAPTFYLLGSSHLELGERREAEGALRRTVELEPGHARAWLRLGELLEANGEVMGAIEAYTAGIHADPRLPYGYNHLGGIYARYDHPEEAIAVFRNGLENCGDPTNANDLGALYLETGQYTAAVEVLEHAVERDPGSVTYNYNLGMAYAQQFGVSQDERDRQAAIERLHVAAARCATLGSQARCNAIRNMLENLEPVDDE